jgi:hypothetical protein
VLAQLAGLIVEHAHGAQRKSLLRLQQRSRIKPQVGIALDQWIVSEAGVFCRVGNNKKTGLQNGMRAN